MRKILLVFSALLLLSCSIEEPEKVNTTFLFNCPVKENIVSHINDKVHFSDSTITLEFLKGEVVDVYAEAFDEDSVMYIVRKKVEAVNDTIALQLVRTGFYIDGDWIDTIRVNF